MSSVEKSETSAVIPRDGVEKPWTLPSLLVHRAAVTPQAIASREKVRGAWRATSWDETLWKVAGIARGLVAYGFVTGSRLLVLGPPSARQLWVTLAGLGLGGIVVPVTDEVGVTSSPQGLSTKDFVVLTGVEPGNELREAASRGIIGAVIVDKAAGEEASESTFVSLDQLAAPGREPLQMSLQRFRQAVAGVRAEDQAFALESHSGWDHRTLVALAQSVAKSLDLTAADRCLQLYAQSWPPAIVLGLSTWLCVGWELGFPEEPASTERDGREFQVTCQFAPPSFYDAWARAVRGRFAAPGTLRRRITDWGLAASMESGSSRVAKLLAGALVLRPLRRVLGSRSWRLLVSIDDAPEAETKAFLSALGIPTLTVAAAAWTLASVLPVASREVA